MSRSLLFRAFANALMAARRANLESNGLPAPIAMNRKEWNRRRFLKATAAAGPAAVFGLSGTSDVWAKPKPANEQSVKVAIIGGGIAGLHAAYQLKKAGVVASLYEASTRLGGRILTRTGDVANGLISEHGGEFINSDHEDMLTLVNEFNLNLFNRIEDGENSPFPKTGYYFAGKIRQEQEIAELLRPFAAQIVADAALLDQDYEKNAPRFDQLSVSQYLDQHASRIRDPYIRTLIENSIRTEYGVEPGESSALQLLFILPSVDGTSVELLNYSDEVFVIKGGNRKVIDGLAQALSDRIHMRMRLTKLQTLPQGGFRLSFEDRQTIKADYVILAIPFTVLRQIPLDTPLPENMRQFIDTVDLGANEKIIAGFKEKIWRNTNGFSCEAWTDLGFPEVWDATQSQFEHKDGALTFYLGGNEVGKKASEPHKEMPLGKKFVDLLDTYIPGAKAAATGKFVSTNWNQNPYTFGAYSNFKPGQLTHFGHLLWIESEDPAGNQQVRAGNLVFAGEHLSDEFYGFMNGGAQTGRLAAQSVLNSIMTKQAYQSETK